MAFDGVPIGISDGLPQPRRFCLGRCQVSGCPGLENALGAVEMVLVPSDCNYFDSPACLATGRLKLVGLIYPRNQGRYSFISQLLRFFMVSGLVCELGLNHLSRKAAAIYLSATVPSFHRPMRRIQGT